MSVVNPSRDKVFQEGPSSPAPSKTEENPLPLSDAVSEKQVDTTAMRKSEHKRYFDELFSPSKIKQFYDPWKISDGFDVGPEKPLGLIGAPLVMRETDINNWRIDTCFKCLDLAIKSDKKSNLEFVQLVKYNTQFESRGETYSITFKAKDKEGREDVYQAEVFNPEKSGDEMKVFVSAPFRDLACEKPPPPFKTDSMPQENPFPLPDSPSQKQVSATVKKNSRGMKASGKKIDLSGNFMWRWAISNGFNVGEPTLLGLNSKGDCLVMKEYYINRLGIGTCFKCMHFAIKSGIKSDELLYSNLELVEIVKYNIQLAPTGEFCYLTFKARDKEDSEDVYQAKVFNPFKDGGEMKVVIFRKKPIQYQQKKGAKKKGGCGKKKRRM